MSLAHIMGALKAIFNERSLQEMSGVTVNESRSFHARFKRNNPTRNERESLAHLSEVSPIHLTMLKKLIP